MKPALHGTHIFPLGFYIKEEIVILFIMLYKVFALLPSFCGFSVDVTAAMWTALIDGQEQDQSFHLINSFFMQILRENKNR